MSEHVPELTDDAALQAAAEYNHKYVERLIASKCPDCGGPAFTDAEVEALRVLADCPFLLLGSVFTEEVYVSIGKPDEEGKREVRVAMDSKADPVELTQRVGDVVGQYLGIRFHADAAKLQPEDFTEPEQPEAQS